MTVIKAALALVINFLGVFGVVGGGAVFIRLCGVDSDCVPWWGFPLWVAGASTVIFPALAAVIVGPWMILFRPWHR